MLEDIKASDEKIIKEDRSPYVRDFDYGDIQGHDLQQLDEPVMSKIEYSPTNDRVAEDYSELDNYLETRFIPSYVLLKQRKNEAGEKEFYPSIRLHHITSLKLSEAEFQHVMNYLKEKNIRVGGKDSTVDGEFENYDYITTYKAGELPKNVPASVNLQNIMTYRKTNDEMLREKIIEDNMRLVTYVTKKYVAVTGIVEDELNSYGYEGLMLAIDRFDPSLGNTFSTYAVAYIRGFVLSGITEIFVGKRDNFYYDYVNAKAAVEKENGVTLKEAPDLIEDVIDLLQATGKINDKERDYTRRRITALAIGNVSLNDPELVEELLVSDEMVDPHNFEDEIMSSESSRELNDMLDTLTEKESDVLRIRFGMYDGETHSLNEVGQIFGATKDRIRQIELKGIRKLRHPSRAKHIREFYD